jgi:hypothetical protein
VRELGGLGSPGLARLAELAAGSDWLLATGALTQLADLEDAAGSALPVVQRLAADARQPAKVRDAALVALARIDADARQDALRRILLSAHALRGQARQQALKSLEPLAADYLSSLEALLDDDDLAVRYTALTLLMNLAGDLRQRHDDGDISVWPLVLEFKALARRAMKHSDVRVRKAAEEVLIMVDKPLPAFGPLTSVIPVVGWGRFPQSYARSKAVPNVLAPKPHEDDGGQRRGHAGYKSHHRGDDH